ncbi:MAG: hypothetical protein HYY93_14370 [Planctomycetes bacterium]|nr:hypothetical protein [Planctomycetota bacterium]
MLSRKDVRRELERFVTARVWVDKSKAAEQLQKEKFQTTALPFYAVLTPEGAELGRLIGYNPDGEARLSTFLGLLEKAP